MTKQAIDNGFLLISAADAKKLTIDGTLPGPGRERLIEHEGQHYWLARTRHNSKMRWSIRATRWRLVGGQAVLA